MKKRMLMALGLMVAAPVVAATLVEPYFAEMFGKNSFMGTKRIMGGRYPLQDKKEFDEKWGKGFSNDHGRYLKQYFEDLTSVGGFLSDWAAVEGVDSKNAFWRLASSVPALVPWLFRNLRHSSAYKYIERTTAGLNDDQLKPSGYSDNILGATMVEGDKAGAFAQFYTGSANIISTFKHKKAVSKYLASLDKDSAEARWVRKHKNWLRASLVARLAMNILAQHAIDPKNHPNMMIGTRAAESWLRLVETIGLHKLRRKIVRDANAYAAQRELKTGDEESTNLEVEPNLS